MLYGIRRLPEKYKYGWMIAALWSATNLLTVHRSIPILCFVVSVPVMCGRKAMAWVLLLSKPCATFIIGLWNIDIKPDNINLL